MISIVSKNIFHPLHDIIHRSSRLQYLKTFESSQFWKKNDLYDWQLIRLKKMLIHAYETVPFYNERFKACDFDPYSFSEFKDLEKIPYLTKKDIQVHKDTLISKIIPAKYLVPNKTGGSTGKPLHFFQDKNRTFIREASTIRHNRWAGYNLGDKAAVIWGHRLDIQSQRATGFKAKLRKILLDRVEILDASSITLDNIHTFFEVLKSYKPKNILAYANSIYLVAKHLENYPKLKLNIESIITSAEMLYPERREIIEKVFQTKVFDRYGCREVSVIASECEMHTGLHINSEVLYLEICKNDKVVTDGTQGDIIITDLFNFAMPFIRYKIEDIGTKLQEECTCGRTLPLLKMDGGRVTDFIKTPEGTYVSGAALTIYLIANIKGIGQAQIVQDKLNHIIFRIVKSPEFSEETVKDIKKIMPEFFKASMQFDIDFVNEIKKTDSGKYLFCISQIEA